MDQTYALGAVKNKEDSRDIPVGAVQAPVTIPASYKTDISMIPVLDQKQLGACVGHAHASLLAYLEYVESGHTRLFSPRDLYALAKKVDGLSGEGTYPRVVDNIMFNHGCALTDLVPNDTTLPHAQYIDVNETPQIIAQASIYKIKGYAFVPADKNAIMQALYQNQLVTITITVGSFDSAPIKPGNIGSHRVLVYGYQNTGSDVKFFFRNSWNTTWGDNGNGYFLWSDYQNAVSDINTYIDIPDDILIQYLTLKMGSKGPLVSLLQTKIGGLVVDGSFGAMTKAAVIAWQLAHNLTGDGVVGPRTWKAFKMVDIITAVCTAQGIEPLLGVSVATCESVLNPDATLYNSPSDSTDRGLFQWNNKYHPEITDVMAFSPAQATKLFCDAVKAGNLHNYWSASQPCWKKKLTPELIAKYNVT